MQQMSEVPYRYGGTAESQCRSTRRLARTSSTRGSASSVMASTWVTEKSSTVGQFPASYAGDRWRKFLCRNSAEGDL